METTFGVLCLIPPILAIVLALITKQTILSLLIATWVGSTIINGWNPLVGFVKIISDYVMPSISGNASLLVLVTLSGGLIAMLRNTGAAEAFANRVTKVINTAKKGQIVTCLSAFIFCYTEPCLMLGTIMRPVTDTVRVSRAKLSYILDSMGCNLACFSPISSYGPFITGLIAAELLAAGVEASEWGIWLNMLPFNLYSLFAMVTVIIVAVFGLNFGPMRTEEERALKTGKLLGDGVDPLVPEVKNVLPEGYELSIWNFIVPMAALGNAMSSYTAQNLGSRQQERVVAGYHAALRLTGFFAVILCISLELFHGPITASFLGSDGTREALATGSSYLKFIGFFFALIGLKMCTDGLLRGAAHMKAFTIANLANLSLRVIFAMVMAPRFGIAMVWYAVPLGWAVNFLISYLEYRSGRWRIHSQAISETAL